MTQTFFQFTSSAIVTLKSLSTSFRASRSQLPSMPFQSWPFTSIYHSIEICIHTRITAKRTFLRLA